MGLRRFHNSSVSEWAQSGSPYQASPRQAWRMWSAAWRRWRRGKAPSWPGSLQDTPAYLRQDTDISPRFPLDDCAQISCRFYRRTYDPFLSFTSHLLNSTFYSACLERLLKNLAQTLIKYLQSRSLPREKGRKAVRFTNLHSSFRKWFGLKVWGVSHSFLSNSTDVKLGITITPWQLE